MLISSGDPVVEFFEVCTFAGFKSSLSVGHTHLLKWPGVIRAEIEEVPKLGVLARGLQNVAIVHVWVRHHRNDYILQTHVVRLYFVLSQHVGHSISIFTFVARCFEPVKKKNIHSDLRFIIDKLEALLNCRDAIKTHSGAAISVRCSVDKLREEKAWERG